MTEKVLKILSQFICNLKDLIITGFYIGTLAEIGIVLFIISIGHKIDILTVIITYLLATLIGIITASMLEKS